VDDESFFPASQAVQYVLEPLHFEQKALHGLQVFVWESK